MCLAGKESDFPEVFIAVVAVGYFHFLFLSDDAKAWEDNRIDADAVSVADVDRSQDDASAVDYSFDVMVAQVILRFPYFASCSLAGGRKLVGAFRQFVPD